MNSNNIKSNSIDYLSSLKHQPNQPISPSNSIHSKNVHFHHKKYSETADLKYNPKTNIPGSIPTNASISESSQWQCTECGVKEHETPLKRKGPDGQRTLCNACYVRWRVRCERAERGSARPTPQQIANAKLQNNPPLSSPAYSNPVFTKHDPTENYPKMFHNSSKAHPINNWNQFLMTQAPYNPYFTNAQISPMNDMQELSSIHQIPYLNQQPIHNRSSQDSNLLSMLSAAGYPVPQMTASVSPISPSKKRANEQIDSLSPTSNSKSPKRKK